MNSIPSLNFRTFLSEMQEQGLDEFRTHDKTYRMLLTKRGELWHASSEIVGRLLKHEQKLLIEYFICNMDELLEEKNISYRLGYVDYLRLIQDLDLWKAFA